MNLERTVLFMMSLRIRLRVRTVFGLLQSRARTWPKIGFILRAINLEDQGLMRRREASCVLSLAMSASKKNHRLRGMSRPTPALPDRARECSCFSSHGIVYWGVRPRMRPVTYTSIGRI